MTVTFDKKLCEAILSVNLSPPGQNCRHFADDFSNAFSWIIDFVFRVQFHWSLFLSLCVCVCVVCVCVCVCVWGGGGGGGPTDNKPALIRVIDWRRTGDNPLPESILTQFTETYISVGSFHIMGPCIATSSPSNTVSRQNVHCNARHAYFKTPFAKWLTRSLSNMSRNGIVKI